MRAAMPRAFRISSILVAAAIATSTASADVKLPAIFGDHMVLQQQRTVPVWGWADAGEKVTVTIGGQSKSTTAGKDGKWRVDLGKLSSSKPLTMTVAGKNKLTISDVLVGEVWLASGQSNMAMRVNRCKDFQKEQAAAKFPNIRMFTVGRKPMTSPQADCTGRWVVCSPSTVAGFSATAYFFGRKLHRELKVPVGLINSSVGGTPVEAWTSLDAQIYGKTNRKPKIGQHDIDYVLRKWKKTIASYNAVDATKIYERKLARWKTDAKKARAAGKKPRRRPRKPVDPKLSTHRPANLFNGMIAPLIPFAIRGAIWYQGEHNASREYPEIYGYQLHVMILDWRRRWNQGDFPFLFVQLPNFRNKQRKPVEPSGWVTVRDQMFETLSVRNTGMAITVDIGEARDIHPKNKQDVGKRLALWALGTTYKKKVVYSGPIPKAVEFDKKSDKVRVIYAHIGSGLKTSDGKAVRGFVLAGKDRKWVFANAKIVGNQLIVWSDKVKRPHSVGYAWAANPDCNLINSAGLPATPFKEDGLAKQGCVD